MNSLNTAHYYGIINAFNGLHSDVDTLIVDTASGAHHDALNFVNAAHEVIMVICNEPASILNAHALIYKLSEHYNIKNSELSSIERTAPCTAKTSSTNCLRSLPTAVRYHFCMQGIYPKI